MSQFTVYHDDGVLFKEGKFWALSYNREVDVEQELHIKEPRRYKGSLEFKINDVVYGGFLLPEVVERPEDLETVNENPLVMRGDVEWSKDKPLKLEYKMNTDSSDLEKGSAAAESPMENLDGEILSNLLGEDFREVSERELLSRIQAHGFTYDKELDIEDYPTFIQEKRGKCWHYAPFFGKALKERGRDVHIMEGYSSRQAIADQGLEKGKTGVSNHAWVHSVPDRRIEPTGVIRLIDDVEIAQDMPEKVYFFGNPPQTVDPGEISLNDLDFEIKTKIKSYKHI